HRLHQFAFLVPVKVAFFERRSIRRQRLIRMPDADRTADQFTEGPIVEARRKSVGIETLNLHRQRKISLIAPLSVAILLRQGERSIEYRAHLRAVRLTKDHA